MTDRNRELVPDLFTSAGWILCPCLPGHLHSPQWYSTYYPVIRSWWLDHAETCLNKHIRCDSIRVVLASLCSRCGCRCFHVMKAKRTTSCRAESCCHSESTSTRWVSCGQLLVCVRTAGIQSSNKRMDFFHVFLGSLSARKFYFGEFSF